MPAPRKPVGRLQQARAAAEQGETPDETPDLGLPEVSDTYTVLEDFVVGEVQDDSVAEDAGVVAGDECTPFEPIIVRGTKTIYPMTETQLLNKLPTGPIPANTPEGPIYRCRACGAGGDSIYIENEG